MWCLPYYKTVVAFITPESTWHLNLVPPPRFTFRNSPPKRGENSRSRSSTHDNGYTLSYGIINFLWCKRPKWLEETGLFLPERGFKYLKQLNILNWSTSSSSSSSSSSSQLGVTTCAVFQHWSIITAVSQNTHPHTAVMWWLTRAAFKASFQLTPQCLTGREPIQTTWKVSRESSVSMVIRGLELCSKAWEVRTTRLHLFFFFPPMRNIFFL